MALRWCKPEVQSGSVVAETAQHPKSGIYYFRKIVREALRPALGRREFRIGLSTKNFAEAKRCIWTKRQKSSRSSLRPLSNDSLALAAAHRRVETAESLSARPQEFIRAMRVHSRKAALCWCRKPMSLTSEWRGDAPRSALSRPRGAQADPLNRGGRFDSASRTLQRAVGTGVVVRWLFAPVSCC